VVKANLPFLTTAILSVLAGGFIGLGALYYTLVAADPAIGFASRRILGGLAFSLGLILVVVAGAELFTGTNLLVMGWVAKRIPTGQILRCLAVAYVSNFIGAAGLAVIVALSGYGSQNDGVLGQTAISIAAAKCALPFAEAFFRAILCNILVCLAVWLAMAGRNMSDKILAIVFPISAFVACGFEHSIANMYFISEGLLLKGSDVASAQSAGALTWLGFAHNLVPVTLGNGVGGAGRVGLVYSVIYRRHTTPPPAKTNGE
jgi:formate transporter